MRRVAELGSLGFLVMRTFWLGITTFIITCWPFIIRLFVGHHDQKHSDTFYLVGLLSILGAPVVGFILAIVGMFSFRSCSGTQSRSPAIIGWSLCVISILIQVIFVLWVITSFIRGLKQIQI
jgi:hypothetical protein